MLGRVERAGWKSAAWFDQDVLDRRVGQALRGLGLKRWRVPRRGLSGGRWRSLRGLARSPHRAEIGLHPGHPAVDPADRLLHGAEREVKTIIRLAASGAQLPDLARHAPLVRLGGQSARRLRLAVRASPGLLHLLQQAGDGLLKRGERGDALFGAREMAGDGRDVAPQRLDRVIPRRRLVRRLDVFCERRDGVLQAARLARGRGEAGLEGLREAPAGRLDKRRQRRVGRGLAVRRRPLRIGRRADRRPRWRGGMRRRARTDGLLQ